MVLSTNDRFDVSDSRWANEAQGEVPRTTPSGPGKPCEELDP
jgi:hypothetical protein